MDTRFFFKRVTHDTPQHNTTQHNNTTTTPHGDRDRDRQRQRKKTGTEREEKTEEETRQKKRREEKRQDEEREEAWPFLGGVVIFWFVCARDFSLLSSVQYDSSLISFSAPWPDNSFLLSAIFLCSYSFFSIFFFLIMQLQFQIFPNYLFMQLQFFFGRN